MNNTKIDWADSSWNPVTGCLHNCPYCYAAGMVRRFEGFYDPATGKNDKVVGGISFDLEKPLQYQENSGKMKRAPYPYGFSPTFHRYRLDDYKRKQGRTIFVCSMGDLFGEFIPDEWITAVFDACAAAPQHRYLFLTKNPKRYNELYQKGLLPREHWYGHSYTGLTGEMRYLPSDYRQYISIEPLLAPFTYTHAYSWLIIGAESGNRKGKVIPKKEWVDDIVDSFGVRNNYSKIFMKESLRGIMGDGFIQQYPWEVSP